MLLQISNFNRSSSGGSRRRAKALLAGCALVATAFSFTPSCARQGSPPVFDGGSAMKFLEDQCDIGYRYPGTPEHRRLQRYIVSQLKEFGANISLQPFDGVLSTGDTLHLVNIIANYNMKAGKRILLGAHYDTRPWADQDPDPAKRSQPIMGANDGASGVAVLLEIARLLGEQTPPVGVDLVFFDGEDYGEATKAWDFCLGSKHFASTLKGYRPAAAIILDMIGDKDLSVNMEGYSRAASPEVVDKLFSIAEELGIKQFVREPGETIIDDHLPFIQAGIQAVDLIDFDYPYWHTVSDTPDKCAPESLDAIGRVLLEFIWRSS